MGTGWEKLAKKLQRNMWAGKTKKMRRAPWCCLSRMRKAGCCLPQKEGQGIWPAKMPLPLGAGEIAAQDLCGGCLDLIAVEVVKAAGPRERHYPHSWGLCSALPLTCCLILARSLSASVSPALSCYLGQARCKPCRARAVSCSV